MTQGVPPDRAVKLEFKANNQKVTVMAAFHIDGPYDLTFQKRKGGRTLVFDGFWDVSAPAAHLANKRGCYVFAIRAGKGITPIYVGQASKTFKQETFNPANRHKYHDGFSEYAKGTPLMFFVVHPTQKGPTNGKQISEIEDFLIQTGVAKNPGIQNVRGAQCPDWSISGVIRSGKGKRSHAETQFRELFDIQ